MQNKKNSLFIVLPNRMGDCILALPAVKCLKELIRIYDNSSIEIKLICIKELCGFVKTLNIADTLCLNFKTKIKSLFCPFEKLFSFLSSSKLIGLRAEKSYGENKKNKWYLNFSQNIPYLTELYTDLFPDKELAEYLRKEFDFSNVIINNFGLCLELGYTPEQIKSVLKNVLEQPKYAVICMEAANGRKSREDRRWKNDDFFKIGDYIYEKYNLLSYFIGIDKKTPIPERSYFKDFRGASAGIEWLGLIISGSACYIGNDTGPLHLANFLGKPVLGIYTYYSKEIYGAVYGSSNYSVQNPKSIDEIKNEIDKMITRSTKI